MQLWPEKFQNKTNGVTPRRWIRFCNPALSKIITKWTGSDDWILKTEKLAELKKVYAHISIMMSRFFLGSKIGLFNITTPSCSTKYFNLIASMSTNN
jgi:carbohydrate phosphorylase